MPFKTVSDYLKVKPGTFKVELLDIGDAATAVAAAGGVATGAGGTAPSPSPGGRRFALLLLAGGGLAGVAGFVVQQRRSAG